MFYKLDIKSILYYSYNTVDQSFIYIGQTFTPNCWKLHVSVLVRDQINFT